MLRGGTLWDIKIQDDFWTRYDKGKLECDLWRLSTTSVSLWLQVGISAKHVLKYATVKEGTDRRRDNPETLERHRQRGRQWGQDHWSCRRDAGTCGRASSWSSRQLSASVCYSMLVQLGMCYKSTALMYNLGKMQGIVLNPSPYRSVYFFHSLSFLASSFAPFCCQQIFGTIGDCANSSKFKFGCLTVLGDSMMNHRIVC